MRGILGLLLALSLAACQAPPPTPIAGPVGPGPERSARLAALPSLFEPLLAQAQLGDSLAQFRLAQMYENGSGGAPRDPAQSFRWMRAAAEAGDIVAQFGTALYFDRGFGVAKNQAEALRWYKRSADAGYAVAQNNLGLMHERGIGTTQNYAEALALYRKSAEQNNSAAQNNLGVLYLEGRGVTADAAEAGRWFTRGANQGNATAQTNLANIHVNGRGVSRDDVQAYFWYTLAAARLSGDQATKVAEQRDTVAKRLAGDTVAKVQTAARDWRPGGGTSAIEGVIAEARQAAGARTGNGTGFFVSRAGHVLTNAHVVQGCGSVDVRPAGEGSKTASIVALDRANDFALLKIDVAGHDIAIFRSGGAIRQGDGVVAFGYPLASALASEGNLTTGNVTALSGVGDDARLLQISAPIQPGNSGGAVLDLNGHVVGVVVSKLNALRVAQATGDVPQNVNFAIKAALARAFLETNGIEVRSAPAGGQRLEVADVGARARKFTARVDCRN